MGGLNRIKKLSSNCSRNWLYCLSEIAKNRDLQAVPGSYLNVSAESLCGKPMAVSGKAHRVRRTLCQTCMTGPLAPMMLEKKSCPLSSMTMKAGKSSTSISQTASMPRSEKSSCLTALMLS